MEEEIKVKGKRNREFFNEVIKQTEELVENLEDNSKNSEDINKKMLYFICNKDDIILNIKYDFGYFGFYPKKNKNFALTEEQYNKCLEIKSYEKKGEIKMLNEKKENVILAKPGRIPVNNIEKDKKVTLLELGTKKK